MVESVFIPMVGPRGTQCISSQVGCSLACTFCHTGTQKLLRNLTPGDSSQGLWRFTFVENNATASQQHCVYGARRTSLQLEVKEGPDLRYLSQISALKLIMNATILGMSNKRLRSSQTRTVLRCQRAKSRYQHQEWFQVFPNLQSWVG